MLVKKNPIRIGFIKRDKDDSFGNKLVAPGGRVELIDGCVIDGVTYFSVECCASRELLEETGISIKSDEMVYFCSLTLPKTETVVISLYCIIHEQICSDEVMYLTEDEIKLTPKDNFAPGMKDESLLLLNKLSKEIG
jgi:ADP-ribose pyrophosphatase YjhB (NUDIX family)